MNAGISPLTAPPPREELQARLANIRRLMEQESLDVYVAAHPDNVYYLTNFAYIPFERPFFLVVPLDGRPTLIVPGLEMSHAADRVLLPVAYKTYYEFPAPAGQTFGDALKDVVAAGKRVGIESNLPVGHQAVIPGNLKMADIIERARLVKSDYEVGRIAYASAVVQEGLKKVFELSKPGVQEVTIYSEGMRQMMGKVVLEIPNLNLLVSRFLCAVWPKSLSAQPHSVPGLFDTLEEGGPNVTIVTAQADGYSAELERTFFIGRVPEQARAPFEAVMEARALAFAMIKPAVPATEVDEAVRQLLTERGYGESILHRTGHGFGITGHEPPWVAVGSDAILEPNMVISIEPGIYIPGTGGFRHSDTVLVTAEGCQSLTKGPERLEDLIITL